MQTDPRTRVAEGRLDDVQALQALLQPFGHGLELSLQVSDDLVQQFPLRQRDGHADAVLRIAPEDRDQLVADVHVVLAVHLGRRAVQAVGVDARHVALFATRTGRDEGQHGAHRVAELAGVAVDELHVRGPDDRPAVVLVQVLALGTQVSDRAVEHLGVGADQGAHGDHVVGQLHLDEVEAGVAGEDRQIFVDGHFDGLGAALAPAADQHGAGVGQLDDAAGQGGFAFGTHVVDLQFGGG